jgi:serine/threonine-protein kinase
MILGTLQCMAPEQIECKNADPRTDIYVFGTVLYETLTGKKAFQRTSQASLIAAILHQHPPRPSSLRSKALWIGHVVERCLATSR